MILSFFLFPKFSSFLIPQKILAVFRALSELTKKLFILSPDSVICGLISKDESISSEQENNKIEQSRITKMEIFS